MSEPIRYTLTFPSPESHYVEVEASLPTGGDPTLEVMLPVWTPGSYRIRDYSQHVEALRAESAGGNPLEVAKTAKNRWRVSTWGARRVLISYRVYGHELSVRTNYVDADFALLNGAATFLTKVEEPTRRHEVDVVLRPEWNEVVTFLQRHPSGGPHRFSAPDYDTLVDSPIYLGSPHTYRFEIGGIPHSLVDQGDATLWDSQRAGRDLEKISRTECELWGTIPYKSYTFLNLITGSRGGLEHREGSVLMTHAYATSSRQAYLEWLSLAAHEMFHAWNVKRLRPVELGPFDYERENYTRSLWIAEGVTSYFDDLIVFRSGLSIRGEYLASLSKGIHRLQTTPGRRVRTLEEASFDAWIKLYQPNPNTDNSSISYYTKGAVVCFLLDARIRHATDSQRSLDDLLRIAYRRHSGDCGFTGAAFEALASEVAEIDLTEFFDRALRTTQELPYLHALDFYGLNFERDPKSAASATAETDSSYPPAWLGAEIETREGRQILSKVPRNTPAARGGLSVGDEVIATDGQRLSPKGIDDRLLSYRPEDTVRLTISRRQSLREIEVRLASPPRPAWTLAIDPEATAAQTGNLEAWLSSA